MSWIEENKTAVTIGAVGLLVALGLGAYGFVLSGQESDIYQQIKTKESSIESLGSGAYPATSKVTEELTLLSDDLEDEMMDVDGEFSSYMKGCVLVHQDAQGFQNSLKEDSAKFAELCKGKGVDGTDITIMPEAKWLGFELYQASPPSAVAAPLLDFEKRGIVNLLGMLSESGVTKFIRVTRASLPIEQFPVTEDKASAKKGKGATKKSTKGKIKKADMWEAMPIEICFEGDKRSVALALNALAASPDYLFTVSTIRIRNEKMNHITLPKVKKEADKSAASSSSVGSGLALDLSGESVTASGPPSKQVKEEESGVKEVLKPFVGNEKVVVLLAVQLIYFPQDTEDERAK